MDLFLIRHAIAEERRAGLLDADRELTDRGRARFEVMVKILERASFRFDHVYHSPWLRAVQTAELLRPIADGPIISTDGLAQAPWAGLFAGKRPWSSPTSPPRPRSLPGGPGRRPAACIPVAVSPCDAVAKWWPRS